MLHGPLFLKILMFSLPLAASSVLQQIFNSVDVAVVGHFASKQALAAVGSNGPVISYGSQCDYIQPHRSKRYRQHTEINKDY